MRAAPTAKFGAMIAPTPCRAASCRISATSCSLMPVVPTTGTAFASIDARILSMAAHGMVKITTTSAGVELSVEATSGEMITGQSTCNNSDTGWPAKAGSTAPTRVISALDSKTALITSLPMRPPAPETTTFTASFTSMSQPSHSRRDRLPQLQNLARKGTPLHAEHLLESHS